MSRRGAIAKAMPAGQVAAAPRPVRRRRVDAAPAAVAAVGHWDKLASDLTWDDVLLRSRDLSERADRLLERLGIKL